MNCQLEKATSHHLNQPGHSLADLTVAALEIILYIERSEKIILFDYLIPSMRVSIRKHKENRVILRIGGGLPFSYSL